MGCHASKATAKSSVASTATFGHGSKHAPVLLTQPAGDQKPVDSQQAPLQTPTATAFSPLSAWPPALTEPSPTAPHLSSVPVPLAEAAGSPSGWQALQSSPRRPFLKTKVQILGVRGLGITGSASSDGGAAASNVYCLVEITGKVGAKCQTEVVQGGAQVEWDFQSRIADYQDGDDLLFVVRDSEARNLGDVLGTATLTGEQLRDGGFEGELRLGQAGEGIDSFLKVKVQVSTLPAMASRISESGELIADEVKKLVQKHMEEATDIANDVVAEAHTVADRIEAVSHLIEVTIEENPPSVCCQLLCRS